MGGERPRGACRSFSCLICCKAAGEVAAHASCQLKQKKLCVSFTQYQQGMHWNKQMEESTDNTARVLKPLSRAYQHFITGLWANFSRRWNQRVLWEVVFLSVTFKFSGLNVLMTVFVRLLRTADWKKDAPICPLEVEEDCGDYCRHETVCHLRASAAKSKQQLITPLLTHIFPLLKSLYNLLISYFSLLSS